MFKTIAKLFITEAVPQHEYLVQFQTGQHKIISCKVCAINEARAIRIAENLQSAKDKNFSWCRAQAVIC